VPGLPRVASGGSAPAAVLARGAQAGAGAAAEEERNRAIQDSPRNCRSLRSSLIEANRSPNCTVFCSTRQRGQRALSVIEASP